MTPLRVLFLCTGNSARSQMAEALLRHVSGGRVEAFSAGTHPRPEVHPMATATLAGAFKVDSRDLFPKTLDRYVGEPFDYVITVCDQVAEVCPVFPGASARLHWHLPDPAAVTGGPEEQRRAFDETAANIAARLRLWLARPEVAARLREADDSRTSHHDRIE
jgi:protein-tyrosine-phosphatase